MVFALSACGGGGGDITPAKPEDVKGETLADGNISALVPEGWMGMYGPDVFHDYEEGYDPNVIQLVKDAKSEMDYFSNNYVQIAYYEDGTYILGGADGNTTDIEPFTAGGREWVGYIYEGSGFKTANLVAEDGDAQFSAVILLEKDNKQISLEDADVQAILASVQVNK